MSETNSFHADDEDPVSVEDNQLKPNYYELSYIASSYQDDEDGQNLDAAADTWRRQKMIAKWHQWCDHKYPNSNWKDWQSMAEEAGDDVDIRLLMKNHE